MGARDAIRRAGERHAVAAKRHAHAGLLGQLDEIRVVDASQCEKIGALGIEALCDRLVAHGYSFVTHRCRTSRSSCGTGDGAPSNSARAAVVLGNAITSR